MFAQLELNQDRLRDKKIDLLGNKPNKKYF